MSFDNVLTFVLENTFITIIPFVVIFVLIKNQHQRFYSIFDGYFLNYCISISFSFLIIIILMSYNNNIVYYKIIGSNIAQILAIAIVSRKRITAQIKVENYSFFYIFYSLHTIIFILTFVFQFKNFALSVFNDKLLMYSGNGLLVYATRVFYDGEMILLLFKREVYNRKNMFDIINFILILCSLIFLGGKSSTVIYFSWYFTVKYFLYMNFRIKDYNQISKLKEINKHNFLLAVLLLPTVLFLFIIVNKSKINPFSQLFYRFLYTGDIYFLSIPNGVYKQIENFSFIKFYFLSIFNPFRKIFKWEDNPILGFEIVKHALNVKNPNWGPNARFDVVLLIAVPYFFNLMWSFCLGAVIGNIRNKWFMKGNSFLCVYYKLSLIFVINDILQDFSFFANKLFPLIFFIPLLYFVAYVLYFAMGRKITYSKLIPLESNFGYRIKDLF